MTPSNMSTAIHVYYYTYHIMFACYFRDHHKFIELKLDAEDLTVNNIMDGFFNALETIIIEYDIHYGEEFKMLPEITDTWVQARPEWLASWRGTIMVYDDLDRHEGILIDCLDSGPDYGSPTTCIVYNKDGWINSSDVKIMHTDIKNIYLDVIRPECLDHLVRWARGKKRLDRFSQRYGLHLYIDECGVTGTIRGLQLGWDSLPWPDHFPKTIKDEDNLKLSDGTELLAIKAFVYLINKGYFEV